MLDVMQNVIQPMKTKDLNYLGQNFVLFYERDEKKGTFSMELR